MQNLFIQTSFFKPLLLLVTLAVSGLGQAHAALFLDFEGIDGDSQMEGQEGNIALESVDWGVSVAVAPVGSGQQREASNPSFQDLSWTQIQDSSFPSLFSVISTGKVIPKASVNFVTTQSAKAEVYFEMKFENVLLTNLHLSANSSSLPFVNGSFAYEMVELIYTPFDETGKTKSPIKASYNLTTAKGDLAAVTDLFAQGLSGPQFSPVPLPASVWLLATAVMTMFGVRRARTTGTDK